MAMFHENYQNIEEHFDQLVCDYAIVLEMKVGSIQFSHFKACLSVLLVLVVLVHDYVNLAAHAITIPTQLIDIKNQIKISIFLPYHCIDVISKSKS